MSRRLANGKYFYNDPLLDDEEPAPKKKRTKKEQQDIIGIERFFDAFPDEAAAIAFVEECLWNGTPFCPRCGKDETVYRVKNGRPMSHRCRACKRYFSVRTGTVMQGTNLPLRKWLLAIHLMHTNRKGASSLCISREVTIGRHTAWYLQQRIREAMKPDKTQFEGIVEIDETYVGGKERWKHADKKLHRNWHEGKITVFGLREHGPGGRVVAFALPHAGHEELQNAVLDWVGYGATVYSDGHQAYRILPDFGFEHSWINHSIGQYTDGDVTTNGIESFWANFKGMYRGTYHCISWWHLDSYLAEASFRHNVGPGNGFKTMGVVLVGMRGKRITYRGIINEE